MCKNNIIVGLRIIFGVFSLVASGLVVIFIRLNDLIMMMAMLSITLGLFSAFCVYDNKVEKEKTIKEEIKRKLTMIKLENESNLDLLKKMKKRMVKLYPPELMKKKLNQPDHLKHQLTPEEIQLIREGKVWIQKQHCLYDFALQVVEIGHHFDNIFIETIKEYTKKLTDLNSQKDFIQMWIIIRGFRLNVGEMHNLDEAIKEAMKITKKTKVMIKAEIDKRF